MASQGNDLVTGAPYFDEAYEMQQGADLTEVAEFAAYRGGRLRLTTAEREAYAYHQVGLECRDTTNGHTYESDGTTWLQTSPTRGSFVAATSSTGTATVNHGLGVTPSQVFVTDRNVGAIPGQRKVLTGAKNATQIQFVVVNVTTGSVLASNPIEFDWIAYP